MPVAAAAAATPPGVIWRVVACANSHFTTHACIVSHSTHSSCTTYTHHRTYTLHTPGDRHELDVPQCLELRPADRQLGHIKGDCVDCLLHNWCSSAANGPVPHSVKTSNNTIECRCGFSCGTAAAWQRHVQRYEDQAQPHVRVKGAAELDLELNSTIRQQIDGPNQAVQVLTAAPSVKFKIGDRVEVRDRATDSWAPGTVTELSTVPSLVPLGTEVAGPKVRRDGWSRAFRWHEYRALPQTINQSRGA